MNLISKHKKTFIFILILAIIIIAGFWFGWRSIDWFGMPSMENISF